MKLNTLLFILFLTTQSNAQQGAQPMANPNVSSGYTFEQSVGVYNEINGGIVLGNASSANHCFIDPNNINGETENLIPGPGFSIGFEFVFNGNTFDKVAVNTNGWLSFGKSSLGNNAVFSQIATSPLSQFADADGNGTHDMSPNDELRNRVSALGSDLGGAVDSELSIETLGLAPNRVFVAQWKNFKRVGGSGHNYNFQIRLYETTNEVEVVYGSMSFGPNGYSAQVGLGGYVQTDYNNRWVSSSVSSTNSWAATDSGFSPSTGCAMVNTIVPPVSGAIFKWVPTLMGVTNTNFVGLKVFPAVVDNSVNIINTTEIEKVAIYDISGKMMFQKLMRSSNFSLDMSGFSKGVYMIRLSSGNQLKTVKITKK